MECALYFLPKNDKTTEEKKIEVHNDKNDRFKRIKYVNLETVSTVYISQQEAIYLEIYILYFL